LRLNTIYFVFEPRSSFIFADEIQIEDFWCANANVNEKKSASFGAQFIGCNQNNNLLSAFVMLPTHGNKPAGKYQI
jgi:hypothetical protein